MAKKPSKKKKSKKSTKELARAEKKAEAQLTKLKKALDSEIELIRDRLRHIEDDFYDIVQALGRIDQKELWRAEPGCESTGALCEKRGLFGRDTARKLLAIHKHKVSRRVAIDLGINSSFHLARYTDATPEADTVDGLFESNALVGNKRVQSSTSDDLKSAADDVARATGTRKAHESRSEIEREAEAAARKVRRCMRDVGATGADVDARLTRTSYEVIVRLTPEQIERIDEP